MDKIDIEIQQLQAELQAKYKALQERLEALNKQPEQTTINQKQRELK